MSTYSEIVFNKLSSMEVGDSFSVSDFVYETWGFDGYFHIRTFDVYYCNQKKRLPTRNFARSRGIIVRNK